MNSAKKLLGLMPRNMVVGGSLDWPSSNVSVLHFSSTPLILKWAVT